MKNGLMKGSRIDDCELRNLPRFVNTAGNLTALENRITLPFDIKRVYYLYDIPGGAERGGHAHKELEQYVVAASGAFSVLLDDGFSKKTIMLNNPFTALHIVPGIWRELKEFSSGAICLVLASMPYAEDDYIRNYTKFLESKIYDT